MENQLAYDVAEWLMSEAVPAGTVESTTVSLLGMEWEVLPGVWPPDPATSSFTSSLVLTEGSRFLEVGCAAGVTSVIAALRGCGRVVALDIDPAATESTKRNAARHGVADGVIALTSDLFEALDETDVFDLVCSNPPLIRAPEGHAFGSEIERSVYDPGFELHRRFFQEVDPHLAETGRIFMNTSEALGDPEELQRIAKDAGFVANRHHSESIQIPAAFIGQTAAVTAAADQHGMLQLDSTVYEFQRG